MRYGVRIISHGVVVTDLIIADSYSSFAKTDSHELNFYRHVERQAGTERQLIREYRVSFRDTFIVNQEQ